MKYVNALPEKKGLVVAFLVVFSLMIGLVFAGGFTSITGYPCRPEAKAIDTGYCESIEKAIMHPRDLLANKENSLVRFLEAFAVISLFSLVSLSLFSCALLLVIQQAQKQAVLATDKKTVEKKKKV